VRLGNKRTGRTTSDTLTAVDATRDIQPFVKRGTDRRLGATIDKINTGNPLDFVANPDTFSAFDTLFGITNNGFAGRIDGIRVTVSEESSPADTERFGKFPKLAISIPFTKEAIVGMVGKEQFDDSSPGIDNAVGLGFNLHSGTHGKGAGGDETSLSFDFNDADAAGTGGSKSFVVAEGGNINSGTAESVKKHFALSGVDLTTIDFNLNGMGHVDGQKEKYIRYIVRHFSGTARR